MYRLKILGIILVRILKMGAALRIGNRNRYSGGQYSTKCTSSNNETSTKIECLRFANCSVFQPYTLAHARDAIAQLASQFGAAYLGSARLNLNGTVAETYPLFQRKYRSSNCFRN